MLGIKLPKDWDARRIGEIACEVSNRNSANEDLPVLSCTKYDGLVDSLKYFKRKVFSNDISKYKLVPKNHFAYATNHIEEGSIGYQEFYDKALISPIYTVFKTGPKIYDPFLFFLLKTELYRHIFEINTSASVDRRGSLRWKEFSQIEIPLPPAKEQRVIVKILSTWDQAIETLGKLIEAKTKLKKGLMQKMLIGKMRFKQFNGKWKTAEIGDLLDYEQPVKYLVDTVLDYDENLTPVLTANKSFILGSTSDKNGICTDLPVIIFDDFTTNTKYVDFPFKVKSSAIKILRPKDAQIDLRFVYEAMKIVRFPSGAEHKRYFISEFQYFTIDIPGFDEQAVIGNMAKTIDVEINGLKQKLVLLTAQKKGLMQKLLTGKIRVKK